MIGMRSITRSKKCWTPRLRFFACKMPMTEPTPTINSSQPVLCTNLDRSITMRVNAGRSAPNPWNSDSNSGITKISRIVVTTIATTTTAAG